MDPIFGVVVQKTVEALFARLSAQPDRVEGLRASPEASAAALTRHLTEVERWSAALSFYGLLRPRQTLEAFFPIECFVLPRRHRATATDSLTPVSLDEALNAQDPAHFVLFGQPGGGKTTTIRYLSQRILHDEELFPETQFPLVVRLRLLQPEPPPGPNRPPPPLSLLRHLARVLGVVTTPTPGDLPWLAALLPELLEAMPALVLIDGLDEIARDADRQIISDEIAFLMTRLSSTRIVLTARTGEVARYFEGAAHLELAPLRGSDVLPFAQRWLGPAKGAAFVSALRKTPFFDTALRPLTLSQLCALYERTERLPDRPRHLYDRIVQLLLHLWDEERGVMRQSAFARFGPERKYEFLRDLAYHITLAGGRPGITKATLSIAYSALRDRFDLPAGAAAAVLAELETHTGLLLATSHDSWEFANRPLQEFLCASYLVSLPNLPTGPEWGVLANELAIAVSLSSRPAQYLRSLLALSSPGVVMEAGWLRTFVNRLKLEQPDFEYSDASAVALLALAGLASRVRPASEEILRDLQAMATHLRSRCDAFELFERADVTAALQAGEYSSVELRTIAPGALTAGSAVKSELEARRALLHITIGPRGWLPRSLLFLLVRP